MSEQRYSYRRSAAIALAILFFGLCAIIGLFEIAAVLRDWLMDAARDLAAFKHASGR